MRVVLDSGETLELGETEATPTIGIVDYSRRVTDDYGVTTVVERGFARRMSVRLVVPFDQTDALQASLAAIRAKPARWIADEGVDWLDFRGFFKDFEIDLPVPPKAYCTLTVEALTATEGFADPGGDPAPLGHASTLQLLQPAAIEGGALVAGSVTENDYPEWSADTTYPLGARVIKAATHRIYESGAIGNKGNDPSGVSGKWRDIGATNRWAMFDQALGSTTEAPGQITVTLAAGAINAAALLDVKAATVRVQAAGYDRTVAPNAAGTVTFLDLPGTAGQVTVTITGPGTVEVGTLLVGKLVGLGSTTEDAKAGITDFSRKEADEFGEIQIVQRAWAKRMTLPAKIRRDAIDLVAGRIAAVRAKPSLWIGKEGMETLTVYGFFKDFSIAVDTTICTLSLSIEGLSTAGKVEPLTASVDWPGVGDPVGTKPEDNATVGAPAGTPVAGKPAEQVVEDLAQLDLDVAQATINIAAAQGTIAQMQIDAAATKGALEADIASINATTAQIQADAADTRTSLESAQASIAAQGNSILQAQADIIAAGGRISTIEGTLGDQDASITSLAQTVSNHTGRLASVESTLTAHGASINQNAQAISTAQGDLASLSSTVSAHTASIAQNASAISTAQGNLASLSSTVTSQGSSISQLLTASSTAAGNIATLQSQVVAGNPNMLRNPSFSEGLNYWNYNGPIPGTSLGWATDAVWGTYASIVGLTSSSTTLGYVDANVVSAYGGQTYSCSCNMELHGSGEARGHIELLYIGSNGSEISRTTGPRIYNPSFSNSKVVRGAITATGLAPGGTVSILVRIVFTGNGGSLTFAGFTQVKLEASEIPTAFSDEVSVRTQYQAISANGTQIASLSSTVGTQGSTIASHAQSITNLQGSVASLSSTVGAQGASISSLQSASSSQAGQIASIQQQIVAGGGNLLTNTEFAAGLAGWTTYSTGMDVAPVFSVNGAGSTWQLAGTNTAAIYQSSSTRGTGYADLAQGFAVEQGKIYEVFVLYGNHRSAASAYLQFFDASGALLGGGKGTDAASYSGGVNLASWGQFILKSDPAPTGAVRAVVTLRKWMTNAGTTDSWLFLTRPQVVETTASAASPQRYSPGSARASIESQANAISSLNGQYASLSSTVSTQGASISANANAITALNGNFASLNQTVSAQGSSISSAQSAISTLQAQSATLTTQVRAGGGVNLIPNSSFENKLTGWGLAGQNWNWASGSNWGTFANWYVAGGGSANGYYYIDSPTFYTDATGIFTASFDFDVTTANNAPFEVWSEILWLGTSGSEIARSGGPHVSAAGARGFWYGNTDGSNRRDLAHTAIAPTGTVKALVRLVAYSTQLQTFAVRQVKMERGAIATPYTADASIVQSFEALSSLNTQYASLSSTVSTQGVTVSQHSTAITTINSNITSIMGRWGVEIDANGYVSGIALNNNGARADFAIRADRFKMVPPGGNGSDGKYIVVDGNGRTTDYILYQGVRVVEMGWRD